VHRFNNVNTPLADLNVLFPSGMRITQPAIVALFAAAPARLL
jgi:hypothetical protein